MGNLSNPEKSRINFIKIHFRVEATLLDRSSVGSREDYKVESSTEIRVRCSWSNETVETLPDTFARLSATVKNKSGRRGIGWRRKDRFQENASGAKESFRVT